MKILVLGMLALLSSPNEAALTAPARGFGGGLDDTVPFVENLGQWPTTARFVASRDGLTVRVESDGIYVQLESRQGDDRVGHLIRLGFEGSSGAVVLRGEGEVPGRWSYFLGKEEEGRWRTAVRSYEAVVLEDLYPGVDLVLRSSGSEVGLELRSDDDLALEVVAVVVQGVEELDALTSGRCEARTSLGKARFRVVIDRGGGAGGLTPAMLVPDELGVHRVVPLVVESESAGSEGGTTPPQSLEWSTYLGGASSDVLYGLAAAEDGVITICGETGSPAFPTTPGPFTEYGGWTWDGFVSQVDPSTSEFVFSALIGGAFDDAATDVALGGDGSVYVCGSTRSANFPSTRSAFQSSPQGLDDGFVLQLAAGGAELVYSTFLGTNGDDGIGAIAVEPGGEVTVSGVPGSPTFPVTAGAFNETFEGYFVTRLDSGGSSLVYSTFLGKSDAAMNFFDMASFGDGRVVICGESASLSYPTTPGAFSETNSSLMPGINGKDMVVTILSADGSSLEASTYVGGDLNDRAKAVAIGPNGDVYVTGSATAGFPVTSGAFQTNLVKNIDAVALRLTPALDALVYATYLGGNQFDTESGWGIVVDASGVATVSGTTNSLDFPVTPGALSETNPAMGDSRDAFVTRISPSGDRLFYSTYLGGSLGEERSLAAWGSHGSVVVAGRTTSPDFPIPPGALFSSLTGQNGASDAYIARLSLLPTGVRKIGTSAESCLGEVFMGVTKMAESGDPTFGVTCSGAPPSSGALLSLGFGEFPGGGLVLPEFTYYLDVFKPIVVFADDSDAAGYAEFDLPLPPGTAGLEFFMQYIWVNTAACGGLGRLSGSNALGITVQ